MSNAAENGSGGVQSVARAITIMEVLARSGSGVQLNAALHA